MNTSSSPPRLVGDRTRLRGIVAGDLPAFYALHADPRVMRYWSFPAWTEPSQAGDYFDKACSGNDPGRLLCWAVTGADDRLIGTVTLYEIEPAQGRAGIGYALAADHWGRGLAREATALAIGHAFGTLGLRRIEADIDPRNASSCRLAERLGFVREGVLRERWDVGGELCDTALYGLLARDWAALAA